MHALAASLAHAVASASHALAALPRAPLAGRGALLLVGIALLVAGRKLFWLAVGALGFVAGWRLAVEVLPHAEPLARLICAVALGIVGIVLAVVLQKVAVGLAGFFLGVLLAERILPLVGAHFGTSQGLVIGAIGIVGAVIALMLFGLALVVLTAGSGASLLVEALQPPASLALVLLLVLWVIGILVQRRWRD